MTAPLLWIALPLGAGGLVWLLRSRPGLMLALSLLVSGGLVVTAYLLPFDEPLRLGPLALRILPSQVVVGREFILPDSSRPLLMYFYGLCAFWTAGSFAAGLRKTLAPYGLVVAALSTAALAVRPGLYAAFLIEALVLVCIPLLSRLGRLPSPGAQRFLVLGTLAMPLYILGSWALNQAAAKPTDATLLLLTGVFLGLALALLLAIFPLFSWMTMLAGQSHPYASTLIFQYLPVTVLLLLAGILKENGWIRSGVYFQDGLRLAGGITIILAGGLAAMERHAGRLTGFIVLAQNGFALLSFSLASTQGDEITVMSFLPNALALGLLGLALAVILQHSASLDFADLQGTVQRTPVAVAGLAVGTLSLAGLPLLALFPLRYILLLEVATEHPIMALGVILGWLALLVGCFRLLAVVTGGNVRPDQYLEPQGLESRVQIVLLSLAGGALFIIGLAPRLFLSGMSGLLP